MGYEGTLSQRYRYCAKVSILNRVRKFSHRDDRIREKEKYNSLAIIAQMRSKSDVNQSHNFVHGLPLWNRVPFESYYAAIAEVTKKKSNLTILEIGAGLGQHSHIIANTANQVFLTDISIESVKFLSKIHKRKNIESLVADIEELPFQDNSIDLVIGAGVLSYGENRKVMEEIYRVLKPSGYLICIDSLNHNPIYRINRYLKYIVGKRTLLTLRNMPTLKLIKDFESKFGYVEVKFYGNITWIMPILNLFFSEKVCLRVSEKVDSLCKVKKSAFKFVMVAKKVK